MSNVYKNAFYLPTTTANTTVYTCNATARAIIQNIQIANSTGSNIVQVLIYSSSANTTYVVSYASIVGPTYCNLATGPIVLQENDAILLSASSTSNVSGTLSIMEVNRSAIAK
jgi:hypothetical protein